MADLVARVAVSAAAYSFDKPFDYLIPATMVETVRPGLRVTLPFGRGNRQAEGIVLAVKEAEPEQQLKPLTAALDPAPVLSEAQLKLCYFMREQFFCTVYEAARAMLPAGLWFDSQGRRLARDKTVQIARLRIAEDEARDAALTRKGRAPMQSALLELLCSFPELPVQDLLAHTGASRQSLRALENAELVECFERETYRRPELPERGRAPLPALNLSQERAFLGLDALAEKDGAQAALLFGVTGSGKTSVYIHLIDRQLRRGRSAILLVPEIALTPQMLRTFSSHFGDEVAVLHSSLSIGERYDEWKRVREGKARLVIGTRSAIFAPVEKLGLVIIDEEQEESYRSENSPRYHARDVARYLCSKAGALLLLGSATPDLVTRYRAETGRYAYFSLPERYNDRALPEVQIVDMRQELRSGNTGDISRPLRAELEKNLEKGEQSILFLNRRGAHKLVSCGECGYTYRCPNCSVALTYHSVKNRLICHYCGHVQTLDGLCPECGGTLHYSGTGTQHVEDQLKELFPGVELLRMDTDTVAPAGSHKALFDRFRTERIPIMVGTQMVTKGLNFENVTLVGVLNADQSLYAGDYRAGERSFSLITQVVGRSGRGSKPGRALIQTFTPQNQTIRQAAAQDYEAFYRSEMELRRLQNAPPLCELLCVTVSGLDEEQVLRMAHAIRGWLDTALADRADVSILGPAPLTVVKVKRRYRYRITLACHADRALRRLLTQIVTDCRNDKRFKGLSVYAESDPLDD